VSKALSLFNIHDQTTLQGGEGRDVTRSANNPRWNSWTSIKKRLEFFIPCYPNPFLLADFKENNTLLWF
jgi:hypothetical protein